MCSLHAKFGIEVAQHMLFHANMQSLLQARLVSQAVLVGDQIYVIGGAAFPDWACTRDNHVLPGGGHTF